MDIRAELDGLAALPPWGRKQNDDWDSLSNFVYRTVSLDELRRQTRRVAAQAKLPLREFGQYVVNRWYNYHTHQVVLDIICAYPQVRREANPRNHEVDFYLDGVGFDLELSRFPRAYERTLAQARAQPQELVNWLYREQSSRGRYHTANRFFVVLHHAADPARTWEVRRMFGLLEETVAAFFDSPRLLRADFVTREGKRAQPLAALLFCVYGE